jgi:tetratricopeptide (TPR) repeat protein
VDKAIKCYEAALRVRTEQDFPYQWATTQFNLALLRFDITEREEACEGMRRAAKTYREVGAVHDASDAERWLEQNCN